MKKKMHILNSLPGLAVTGIESEFRRPYNVPSAIRSFKFMIV